MTDYRRYVLVPNAPCGVESLELTREEFEREIVPNAPCGVESLELTREEFEREIVPNAPCGVESPSCHT
jgi:hypothetical protein